MYEGRKGLSEEMTPELKPRDARNRCAQSPGECARRWGWCGQPAAQDRVRLRSRVCAAGERRER